MEFSNIKMSGDGRKNQKVGGGCYKRPFVIRLHTIGSCVTGKIKDILGFQKIGIIAMKIIY